MKFVTITSPRLSALAFALFLNLACARTPAAADPAYLAQDPPGMTPQVFIMVFPELEMVVAINAGSYGSGLWYRWGLQVIPRYLVPAALEPAAN